jgi:hypothetical protein
MSRSPARKAPAPSLSKTQNVTKLTSHISSSRRMFSRLSRALRVIVSKDGVGVAMDALLASDNDNPAAPRTGTVFRLEVRDTEILRRLTARLTLKPPQDTPNELRMHTPPRGRDKNSGCCEHVFYPAVFTADVHPSTQKKRHAVLTAEWSSRDLPSRPAPLPARSRFDACTF